MSTTVTISAAPNNERTLPRLLLPHGRGSRGFSFTPAYFRRFPTYLPPGCVLSISLLAVYLAPVTTPPIPHKKMAEHINSVSAGYALLFISFYSCFRPQFILPDLKTANPQTIFRPQPATKTFCTVFCIPQKTKCTKTALQAARSLPRPDRCPSVQSIPAV